MPDATLEAPAIQSAPPSVAETAAKEVEASSAKTADIPSGESSKEGSSGKKRKYVVDGSEVEVDLSNEKDIDALIQKGLGASKRFNEVNQMRKQAEKWRRDSEMIVSLLEERPMDLLAHAAQLNGVDARKLVEEWLYENHYKLDQMKPEEKKIWEQQKELERFREEKKRNEAVIEKEKFEAARQAYRANFEKDIIGALEQGGLPKTSRTVQRMASYMHQALKTGVRMSASDVMPLVRQDYEADIKEMLGPMNGEGLARFVGDTNLKKLRDFELGKLRAQGANVATVSPTGTPSIGLEPAKEVKKMSPAEWKEELKRKFG